MITIIAGSREGVTYEDIAAAVAECGWEVTRVVSGTARGADTLGEIWAEFNKVPVSRYPADWKSKDKKAGYIRNMQMAEAAEALIAVWDGQSPGTKQMIKIATDRKLRVSVYRIL